jgi:hypothetical protein
MKMQNAQCVRKKPPPSKLSGGDKWSQQISMISSRENFNEQKIDSAWLVSSSVGV